MNKTRESKTIGIRIPVTWIDKLKELAEIEERSVNSIIRLAIKKFLEERKK